MSSVISNAVAFLRMLTEFRSVPGFWPALAGALLALSAILGFIGLIVWSIWLLARGYRR